MAAAAGIMLLFNFVAPFLLLLLRFVKRHALPLAMVAVMLLALHFLDLAWVIMPGLVAVTWWTVLLTIAMVILVAGTSAVVAGRASRTAAPVTREAIAIPER